MFEEEEESDYSWAECINLAWLLRDLRFDNLNLVWESLCARNEFAAVANRLHFNRRNPEYKQLEFQGLFARVDTLASEVKMEMSDVWGEGVGSRLSLLSQPSYSHVPWTWTSTEPGR